MTEDEVDWVAAELAKAGGVSWYPGRERGPLKAVTDRYRDRARLAITALDRYRASKSNIPLAGDEDRQGYEDHAAESSRSAPHRNLTIGDIVLYRPPGDLRSYPCRIERIDGKRAFLVPSMEICTGWVDITSLLPLGGQ